MGRAATDLVAQHYVVWLPRAALFQRGVYQAQAQQIQAGLIGGQFRAAQVRLLTGSKIFAHIVQTSKHRLAAGGGGRRDLPHRLQQAGPVVMDDRFGAQRLIP